MSSHILIESVTLSSAQSSVTFSSIPTTLNGKTLRDLVLIIVPKVTAEAGWTIRFNNDSSSNYNLVAAFGQGSGAISNTASNTQQMQLGIGNLTATTTLGDVSYILQIMDYAQTNKHKPILGRGDKHNGAALMHAGRWANTSAVSSFTIALTNSANIDTGATFTLYGIEG
jgi:hypothetical protein